MKHDSYMRNQVYLHSLLAGCVAGQAKCCSCLERGGQLFHCSPEWDIAARATEQRLGFAFALRQGAQAACREHSSNQHVLHCLLISAVSLISLCSAIFACQFALFVLICEP